MNLIWSQAKPTNVAFIVDQSLTNTRPVRIVYNNQEVGTFATSPGLNQVFTKF